MAGYTPVFGSIYGGSLYGRWPMAAVWASILPLADSLGRIDMSFEAIAGMTGWPLELLRQGIAQLMEPDPASRSPAEQGSRLVPIEGRPWGWVVVNHSLYRERARKQSWDAQRTSSGRDAERKRQLRSSKKSRRVPTRPAKSRESPLSDSDKDSDSDKNPLYPPLLPPKELPEGIEAASWAEWIGHRRRRRMPMDPVTLAKQIKALLPYPPEVQREMIDTSINGGWQGLFPPKTGNGVRSAAPKLTWEPPPDQEDFDVPQPVR
jgi:hypothetical protein